MTVTAATKEIVYSRQSGLCAKCDNPLDRLVTRGAYKVEYHHMHEQYFGGPDHPDNIAALHKCCHAQETAKGATRRAKAKRLAIAHEAHQQAMATGRRRPNAKQRALAKMDERRRDGTI